MRRLLDVVGEPDPFAAETPGGADGDLFASLVWQILHQGASDAAALQARARLTATIGETAIRPESVRPANLGVLGISIRKRQAITELADQIVGGNLDLAQLRHEQDQAIIARLTEIAGIGEHTVQLFLIHQLHRPDVWPHADPRIRRGLKAFHRLRRLPSRQAALEMGAVWAPYRSYAAAALWEAGRINGDPLFH